MLAIEEVKKWNIYDPESEEVAYEVEFLKLVAAISERTNRNVEEMDTFSFYAMMEYMKDAARKNK